MDHVVFLVERYGLIIVFLNVLLDQAGLPIPCYPALMVAAALSMGSSIRLPEVFAVGVAGAMIADLGWYWTSRRHGRRVLGLVCRISLSPDSCVRQTESLFSKVGPSSLMVAKFVPGLTTVAVVLSGITRLSISRFVLLDAVGAAIYVGLAVLLGFAFRHAIADVLATLATLGEVGFALVVSVLGLYLARRWWQRQGFIRQLRMDRISVSELGNMIDEGKNPIILDVRSMEVRNQEGIIPGAIFAHPTEATSVLALYSRDAEVVIYCSCPNEASAAVAAKHLQDAGFRRIRPLSGGLQAWMDSGRPIQVLSDSDGPLPDYFAPENAPMESVD